MKVEQFTDQDLGPRPHLAVIFRDGVADFVTMTPLLRGPKEKYSEGEKASPSSAEGTVPPVLIATGAAGRAKQWPVHHWLRFVRDCEARGVAVGLLGPTRYQPSWDDELLIASTHIRDLRGKMTLPQLASALRRAAVCVTVDDDIMRLAAAVGTPTLALCGARAHWDSPMPNSKNRPGCPHPHPLPLRRERGQDAYRRGVFIVGTPEGKANCLREELVCMESIEPAVIMDLVDDVLLERLGRGGLA